MNWDLALQNKVDELEYAQLKGPSDPKLAHNNARLLLRNAIEILNIHRLASSLLKKQFLVEAISKEILRLAKLHDTAAATEALKHDHNLAAPRVPSQEVSDRLIRYEAHLSREFDRTLAQLERLQRMRLGQPVLPKLEVRHSLS